MRSMMLKPTSILVPSTGTVGCRPRIESPEVARTKETRS
jgi:hypothetical protein